MSCLNNKNFAFNEMMVHVPLCTHKEPKNILIVGNVDDEFKNEVAKHSEVKATYGDSSIITSHNTKDIDIIIIASKFEDKLLLANINKILKDDGVLVFVSDRFKKDEEKLKSDLTFVGEHFTIAMPFKLGHTVSILASKKYHPTADIVLQKSDLLDELNYYSSEIHLSSFVFPAYIHKSLTNFAKR